MCETTHQARMHNYLGNITVWETWTIFQGNTYFSGTQIHTITTLALAVSACTCVLASFPGRSHRQPVFYHSSVMCVFHTGSDQILVVETTWEWGYVCTVYALGCDLASCSFPRDYDVQTYYMYDLHSCNNVRPTFQASWSTHGLHCSWSTLIRMVAPVLSQVSLCTAGLDLFSSDSLGTVLQWDLRTHTTQARWDFAPYIVSSIAPDPAGEQMKGWWRTWMAQVHESKWSPPVHEPKINGGDKVCPHVVELTFHTCRYSAQWYTRRMWN